MNKWIFVIITEIKSVLINLLVFERAYISPIFPSLLYKFSFLLIYFLVFAHHKIVEVGHEPALLLDGVLWGWLVSPSLHHLFLHSVLLLNNNGLAHIVCVILNILLQPLNGHIGN